MNVSKSKIEALLFCMLQRAVEEDKLEEYIDVCNSLCTRTARADTSELKSVLKSSFNGNIGEIQNFIG